MGSLVWATLRRRWVRVLGFFLLVGGIFLGSASRAVQTAGIVLFVGDVLVDGIQRIIRSRTPEGRQRPFG